MQNKTKAGVVFACVSAGRVHPLFSLCHMCMHDKQQMTEWCHKTSAFIPLFDTVWCDLSAGFLVLTCWQRKGCKETY